MKILVTNFYNPYNLGSLHDFLLLKKFFPKSKIYIFSFPHLQNKNLKAKVITSCGNTTASVFISFLNFLLFALRKNFFRRIDFAFDLAGDFLNDVNYSFFHPWIYFLNLLPVILNKIPYVIFFQSIGPIKYSFNKILAKIILSKASLIIVRESFSYSYVRNLGIKPEKVILWLTPFLFKRKRKTRKKVCIILDSNLKHFLKKIGISPLAFYSKIIDELRKVFKKHELYILPQTIGPKCFPFPLKDVNDISLAKEITDKKKVKIKGVKSLKGFINMLSSCDFCLASRFHSSLFLLYLNVPFICLSYTTKTEALLKDFKLNRYLVKIKAH